MSYVTLLVPVEAEPEADPRLALAVDLANQYGANLIGVGAAAWAIPLTLDAGYAMGAIIDAQTAQLEADLQRAETKFKTAAAAVQQGSDWRAFQTPVRDIAAEARAADLVVSSRSRTGLLEFDPGALVLRMGRPVLVAPPAATALEPRSVIVAWKDSREARRAVADALPILKQAGAVLVAEICAHHEAAIAEARLADVAQYLLRHGVRATTRVCHEEKGVTPAEQFLDLAKQQKADLIVAGAYGHSRVQELVFGGFTKALLEQTSCAVLFSH